jgi:hypothetical protein
MFAGCFIFRLGGRIINEKNGTRKGSETELGPAGEFHRRLFI